MIKRLVSISSSINHHSSTWRFTLHIITALVIALVSFIMPTSQPTTTLSQPATSTLEYVLDGGMLPMPAQGSQPTQCEEDEPCWDCDTMGNAQCSNPNLSDAWESLDDLDSPPDFSDSMILEYMDTVHTQPSARPMGSFSVPSISQPTTWHIFQYSIVAEA